MKKLQKTGFESIIRYLDPNRLDELKLLICYIIENDDGIKNDTVVDLVEMKTKADIRNNGDQLAAFLAGVFIYVLKYTDNRDGNVFVKEIDKISIEVTKVKSIIEAETETIKQEKIKEDDEDVMLEAQRFCIKYENEIDLLPLCQIAYNVDPTHKNDRQMYTDYILCPAKVKRKILQLKSIPMLVFRDNWIDDVVKRYDNQILEIGLASRSFLYEGAKYFHRAYWYYSDCQIVEFDPCIFDTLFKSDRFAGKYFETHGNSISAYVGDYLWYKFETKK